MLDKGLVPEEDIVSVAGWLKGMDSDILQMREVNAKFLVRYLKKGKSKEASDSTKYEEVCKDIFTFLNTYKDLNEDMVSTLKKYMNILADKNISNEDKFIISEDFSRIKMNINFREKSELVVEIINRKYNDNIECKNKLYNIINILLDESKPIEEREKADFELDDFLKIEKAMDDINKHQI